MNYPKVSIIIPAYNLEGYIDKCLESVCAQTLADDMEIIVVDDGSTDNTPQTIENMFPHKFLVSYFINDLLNSFVFIIFSSFIFTIKYSFSIDLHYFDIIIALLKINVIINQDSCYIHLFFFISA